MGWANLIVEFQSFLLLASNIESYNSKKLASINLILVRFLNKDNSGQGPNGTRFERSDWYLTKLNRLLNTLLSIHNLFNEAYVRHLHQAMKLDCLAVFKVLLICVLYF